MRSRNGLALCILAALWITITANQALTCVEKNNTITATAYFRNMTFDEIVQPNFSDGHGKMSCLWTLTAENANHRIKIVIETLYLNHESDRLYVYNGLNVDDSAIIGDYGPCSSGELVLYSTVSSMTLRLVSHNNAKRGKMRVLFKALPKAWITCKKIPDDADTCPTSLIIKRITQKSGFLTSPSFPSSYQPPSKMRCMWRFIASTNHRWIVNVHWMGIHKDHYKNDAMKCNYDDILRIGDPNNSPDVENCGCQRPSLTVSKGRELFVTVVSSPKRYRSGFVLSYKAVSLDDCPQSRFSCRVHQETFGFNINNQMCTDIDEPLPTTTPPTTTALPTTIPPTTTPQPIISVNDKPGNKEQKTTDIQKTQAMGSNGKEEKLDNGISVRCSKHHMTVTIFLDKIEFLSPSSLRLKDKSCSPLLVNQTHVIFQVPLDGCGTYHNSTNDKITYWNHVIGESEENDNKLITRKFHVRLSFDCSYAKRKTLSVVSFSPRRKIVYSSSDGRGNFTFMMDMYKTNKYQESYANYPVSVKLGQRLYLQIVVKSQSKLAIFADTCMATTSGNPNDDPRYDFIQNGCSRDDTLQYDYTVSSYQQFSITAFRFVNMSRHSVFLHCLVQVCMASDNDTVCARGCTDKSTSRQRRAAVTGELELEYLTLGPVRLLPQDASSSNEDSVPRSFIIYIIAGVLVVIIVALTAVIVAILMKKTRQTSNNYYQVTVKQK